MDTTQTAETIDGYAHAFEVRQLNAPVISNHHILDVSATIDQHADLSASFMRELGKLPREFRGDYLVRCDAPGVELFDPAQLIGLQTSRISN